MLMFFFGALAGAFVSWLAWDSWAFWWTAKHNLRADFFTLSREEVKDELAHLARYRLQSTPTIEQIEAAGRKAMQRFKAENPPCPSCGMRIGHIARCAAPMGGEDKT